MVGPAHRLRRGVAKAVVAARGLAELGPETAGAVVASTLSMAARRHRDGRVEDGVPRPPGRLLAVERLGEGRPGVRCTFADAELEVRFLARDLVRVSWGPDVPPVPWALAGGPVPWEEPAVELDGDEVTGCTLRATGGLEVAVATDGALRYRSTGGAELRHELAPLRRGGRRTTRFSLRAGERVAGLGEQAGPVDLAGTAHRLWNRDPGGSWGPMVDPLYCVVPVVVGLHPDGDVLSFYENPYDATVRFEEGWAEVEFTGGMLRHYVAGGPLPELLDRYSALTGRPPLPPRWALGYHQSRWGYRTEAAVREVAEGFGASGLPLSAVHLDIDHLRGYRVFSIDERRFPDPVGLAADLQERGTRVVAIVDPGVKADPEEELYRQGRKGDHFVADEDGSPFIGVVWPGRVAYPDFTDPRTRRWWSGWYRTLTDRGVAGAWHDMNEPTSLSLYGDRTLPPGARHAAEGRGGDHRQCHNVYGMLMDRAGWEALAAERPDRRPFVLSRSGWAGVQRWAWSWTGDSESTWEGLAQQVATVVGMGLSGLAFTGPDIGGFSGAPGPELYLRWLELSALLPFCRTHSVVSAPPREPWRFPEPYRTAIGRLVRFRYRLLPYLYTLAHESSLTGAPLVRPLCWSGGTAWADDAYLLGNALLVAPAVVPGSAARRVTVPDGRWVRWRPVPAIGAPATAEADAVVEGGATVTLDTPLGQPAVLVRAGTVLPLDDGWATPAGPLDPGHRPKLLSFHCFPDADGRATGRCYDDAGDGDGPGRVDRLRLAGGPALEWEREGDYPAPAHVRVVVHPPDGGRAVAVLREPSSRLDLR